MVFHQELQIPHRALHESSKSSVKCVIAVDLYGDI